MAIIFYLRNYPGLSIPLLSLLSLLYQAAVVHKRPFRDNTTELANEMCISVCIYCYMLLSDFAEGAAITAVAGWGLTGTVLVFIAVNMLVIVGQSIAQAKEQVRRACKRNTVPIKREEPKNKQELQE